MFSGPPTVNKMENIVIVEGAELIVNCSYTVGYPVRTTVFWSILGYQDTFQMGSILTITDIQRDSHRMFICVAENTLSSGNKGHSNASIIIDVLCKYNPFFQMHLLN